MGGYAALDMAIALPHRVGALVVITAAPSGWTHTPDIRAQSDTVDAAYESRGIDAANELEVEDVDERAVPRARCRRSRDTAFSGHG